MKKFAYAALLIGALGMVACGGDDDGPDLIFPDANTSMIDSGGNPASCNPVTQMGCDPGDKCAQLVQSADPFLAQTACVMNGSVPGGGACVSMEPGPTGYDDCVAGFDCSGGLCTEICSQGPPDTCAVAGTSCVQFENLFDDVEGDVGLCSPTCNAVTQDCDNTAEACYLQATIGTSTCANIPDSAVGKVQDNPCYGPAGGGCYLNGCDKGHGPVLNDVPDNATGSVCAFFCNPVDTYSDPPGTLVGTAVGGTISCATDFAGVRPNAPGVVVDNWECRFVQSFYSNTDQVPADTGMCVSKPIGWGECVNFDKAGFIDAVNTMSMTYCDPSMQGGVDLCPPGCVSNATFDLWFPASAKRDMARQILEVGLSGKKSPFGNEIPRPGAPVGPSIQ